MFVGAECDGFAGDEDAGHMTWLNTDDTLACDNVPLPRRDRTSLYDVLKPRQTYNPSIFASGYFGVHCVFPVAARRHPRQPNTTRNPDTGSSGLDQRGLALCARYARRDAQHDDREHDSLCDTNMSVPIRRVSSGGERDTHHNGGHSVEDDVLEPRTDVVEYEQRKKGRGVERARLDDQDEHWPQVAVPEACEDVRPVDRPYPVCH